MNIRSAVKMYWLLLALCSTIMLPNPVHADNVQQFSQSLISQCGNRQLAEGRTYQLEQFAIRDGILQVTDQFVDDGQESRYVSRVRIANLQPNVSFEKGSLQLSCKTAAACISTEAQHTMLFGAESEDDQSNYLQVGSCDDAAGKQLAARLSQLLKHLLD